MKGYIITYESNKTTEINHKLFGKVTSVKSVGNIKNYYYPGALHNVLFIRLSRGCIFTQTNPSTLGGLITVIDADLDITDEGMIDGETHWKSKFENIEVKRL